jgi:hypothetical protein
MATNNSLNSPFPTTADKGGTGLATLTAHGILVGEGTSAINPIVLAAGQVLVGTTSSDPAAVTITGGNGITVSATSGAIQISSSLSVAWNKVTGTSQTMVAENGYVSTNAALCTFTLPATASLGAQFNVVANTAAGWSIVGGTATQTIRFGTSLSTPSTGSLSSTAIGDCVDLICVNADVAGSEIFAVVSAVGNLTVV